MILPFPMAFAVPALTEAPSQDGRYQEARSLRMAGRFYEAAAAYRRFIQENPRSGRLAEARFWLASTLEQDQRWDEAAAAYGEFLRLHPDQRLLGKEARLNRIRCWGIRQGQNPEATPGLLAALEDEAAEVRVVSALQLAKTRDRRAVPALQQGLGQSRQAEACRLALEAMGVEPKAPPQAPARFLVIRIQEKGKPDPVVVRVAAGLARAVGGYLSDEQLLQAKRKGVDLDGLMDQIVNAPKGTVLFSVEDKTSSISVTVE
ncbi:MAG TPA: tetratricopeptide repeat protein [Holophagaceae bacterium]|nr:tetratricopeptide repeat protein [Holophagaceae bacterium]